MKIIKLISRNIKNLKAIEISPEGEQVILTGKNGAGKSAIIDSIFSALTGERLSDPIRHGEDRADVTVEMDGFTVKKVWTPKGESLQVYTINEEGKKVKYSSPQTFLDEKIGALSFDPLAFKGMKQTDQIELLKKIVGLDFADLEKEKEAVYGERSILNSKIKESIAHLKNSEAPDPETPDEEYLFKDALKRLQDLRDKQAAYTKAVNAKGQVEEDIKDLQDQVREALEEIARIQGAMKVYEERLGERQAALIQIVLPERISQETIIAAEFELEDLEKKNADIRQAKRYRDAIRQADKLKKSSDELSERLQRLEQDKQTRVSNAVFPVPGLSLTEEGVMYQGILFDRLSTGQQIRVSTAIGMALNPDLKVIFIREGSLLDSANLRDIAEQAKEKDYQVFIEKCDESGLLGFYIEDGAVSRVNGKEIVQPVNASEEIEQEDKAV